MVAVRRWWGSAQLSALGFAVVVAIGVGPYAGAQVLPTLPQTTLNTSYPAMSGTTISVAAGGNLQNALNNAQYGDTISLEAGATFTGTFTLPAKSGSGWIVIRTSAPDSSLPPQGTRMNPSYASVLPKIVANSSTAAIQTAAGAHHYRLVGLEVMVGSGVSINYGVIQLGTDQNQTNIPNNITLDRLYIHGQPGQNCRRGVALNSASTAVIDSYINEFHEQGADTQAIAGWNGPGPFKIVNNYLSAAGENVLFGGADPGVPNLVPTDIEIRQNHFQKLTAWKGGQWQVKNILELKNARRVLIDGNILEYNWGAAQNGFAFLCTPRNQSGTAPWTVVEDVTFTRNILRHSASAFNALGWDDLASSQQTKRVLLRNNIFDDISGATWNGNGRLYQVRDGNLNITIDHNTGFADGEFLIGDKRNNDGFTFTNNINPWAKYGMGGDGTYGNVALTLSSFFSGAVFTKNAIAGSGSSGYPAGNYFPTNMAAVGFVNQSGGDYHLAASSPYKNLGTDGKDLGADIDAVNAATNGVINGNPSGNPPPPPPVDTTPPSVSISAPAAGATVSGTTSVTANASDNVGVVGVQFYVDGAPLGAEDTASPYSASWNTSSATNGGHTLTAAARDAAGNRTTSAGVTVTVSNIVDTTAPSVSITAPFNGASVSGTTTISATASDDVGVVGVQFYVDGAPVGAEDTSSSYSTSWNTSTATNGNHTLTATARDAAGNRTTSAPVSVTVNNFVDSTPPAVSISAPSSGATVSGATTISANASDDVGVAGVQFFVDGAPVGSEDTTNPYSVAWDTTRVANGSHSLTASARDAAGHSTTSAAVSVTVSNAAPAQTPFNGTPFTVPGQFAAEDFDRGGEGLAYHDVTAGNQGGFYRTSEDVDLINPSPNNYVVNNFQAGEWLEYSINASQAGSYKLEALVSSAMTGSRFHMEIDGVDKTGPVTVPTTGSWGSFQWIGKDGVSLTAGQHILRLTSEVEYFNVDTIRLSMTLSGQTPYSGTPASVPGQFEAENFDRGGEAVAYHDLTTGNQGGLYRTTEDVDIISPYAGGYVVNNFQTGEWLEYTISSVQSSSYLVEALVSSELTGRFHIEIDGVDKTGPVDVPLTGSWATFQWVGKGGVNISSGQHTLKLVSDAEYFNVDALRISIVADTTAPSVSVTAPVSGATVTGNVQLTADASDNIGVAAVQFFVDGVAIAAEDAATPYAATWNSSTAANGSHNVTAVARDAAGNSTTSAPVQITVSNPVPDTTAPSVSITAPSNGATVSGSVQVTASASDNVGVAGVKFYVDGALYGGEDTTAPWAMSWNTTTVSNATHTLTAVARDAAGNSTMSASVQVTVANPVPDTMPPSVAITSPANGASVSGTVQIAASASDNVGVAGVKFYVDGSQLGSEDSASPYSASWDTSSIANGSHTLTAVARDAAGNSTTSSAVVVTVANSVADTTPPAISITSPSRSATVTGTVSIGASATDNVGVTVVRFFVDGSPVGVEDTTAPYAVAWDTTTAFNGSHTLTATAWDAAGNNTTATPITVTVANAEGPYHGSPAAVPGRIEAEDFDRGGEAMGYHDMTSGNQGGFYRTTEDVDIVNPYANGYVVNNFQTGEWLAYTVSVAQSGTYRFDALVSSMFATSRFHVEVDGIDRTGSLTVPNTGSWGSYRWVGVSGVGLTSGTHVVKVVADTEYFNFDAISTSLESVTTKGRTTRRH